MAAKKYKPEITVKLKKGEEEAVVDMDALDAMVDEEFFKPVDKGLLGPLPPAPDVIANVEFAASLTKTGSLWQLILMTLKDNVVVKTDVSEGDVKAIVLQKALYALHNFTEPR